jgi:formate hydrogenlyase subunit 4
VPPGDFGVFGCGAKLLQHRLLGGGGGTLALLVVRVLEVAHLFSGSSRPGAEWSRPSGSRHVEVSVVMETGLFLALFSVSASRT